jgi:hypothetical protein
MPLNRKQFNLLHLMVAVVYSAFLFSAARAVPRSVLGYALGYAPNLLYVLPVLGPIYLALGFRTNRRVDSHELFGDREPDSNLLRWLCCASAELVMLTMVWSTMLAIEGGGNLQRVVKAGAEQPWESPFELLSSGHALYVFGRVLPNFMSSAMILIFAAITYVVVRQNGYSRASQWLIVWHLLMLLDLQGWFYTH